MKTLLLTTSIVAGLALMSVGAQAQENAGDRPDFATLDSNGDGQLSLEEMQAAGAMRFADADTDGNGALSLDELTARAEGRAAEGAARMLERFDANEDGELQMEELRRDNAQDRAERRFARVDTDDDGTISEEEFNEIKERGGKRRGRHGGRDGHRGGHGGGDGDRG